MQRYIIQRLLLNIPVILMVITLVFLAGHARPDFAENALAGGNTSSSADYEAALAAVRRQLGTDKPLWKQYVLYIRDVAQGDLGSSFLTKRSVSSELRGRIAPSIELGLLQIMIAVTISVPIGVISAIRQDTWLDYVLRVFAITGLAVPSFFMATLLLLLSQKLGWTPPLINTAYREIWQDPVANLKMMLLPALAGGFAEAAIIMRFLRSQLLEVLRQDYVRTAMAKGLRERSVVIRHALRNALIPVVTILGLLVGAAVGADVVLESLFSIPGVGQFSVISMKQNDFPIVQGFVLVVAVVLVVTNLVVDLAYAWLDPRIRYA